MDDSVDERATRGKQLPREDSERWVDQLLESLNEPAAPELDAAWAAEIDRRLAGYDRGKVKALSAEEVFAKVLDQYLFARLKDVREATWQFLIDYNERRPHDTLDGMTPAKYRQHHQARSSTFDLCA